MVEISRYLALGVPKTASEAFARLVMRLCVSLIHCCIPKDSSSGTLGGTQKSTLRMLVR